MQRLSSLILALLVLAGTVLAAGPLCNTCDATAIILNFKSGIVPGEAEVTATLLYFAVPNTETALSVAESLESGKADINQFKQLTPSGPLVGQPVTFLFRHSDGREEVLQDCKDLLTDADGNAKCSMSVSSQGCGFIVASYVGSADYLAREASVPYCITKMIPFLSLADASCIVVFLFIGLLAAGMYAAGKSPLAAFDITTPKMKGPPEYRAYKYKTIDYASKGWKSGVDAGKIGGSLGMTGLLSASAKRKLSVSMADQTGPKKLEVALGYATRYLPEASGRIKTVQKELIQVGQQIRAASGVKRRELKNQNKVLSDYQKAYDSLISLVINRVDRLSAQDVDFVRLGKATGKPEESLLKPHVDAMSTFKDGEESVIQRALNEVSSHLPDENARRLVYVLDHLSETRERREAALPILKEFNPSVFKQCSDTLKVIDGERDKIKGEMNELVGEFKARDTLVEFQEREERNKLLTDRLVKSYAVSIGSIASVEKALADNRISTAAVKTFREYEDVSKKIEKGTKG
jgi:hypothetical protein